MERVVAHLRADAAGVLHTLIRSIRRVVGRSTAGTQLPLRFDTSGPRAVHASRTHPEDEPIACKLSELHQKLNAERFGGGLRIVPVRVSRRMRSRLGHYAPAKDGAPAEIALSRRHIRRHGFAQAVDTLLHEMVHQWQDESGLPLGHGQDFRAKARIVGITARATRAVE